MTPPSAQVWHPLPCRWHRIHSITTNRNIYDVTSTSGMISHPLYLTLHSLYLFHHNLSTDITPTFEWHHTHLLCDIICTIYNITSNPSVITLLYLLTSQPLYMKPHTVCKATYTLHMRHHIHYLCPHTHCIDITNTLYYITLAIWVPSFALYKTSHPHFMISNHRVYVITASIFDIMSTVSVSSHPFYWWYHTNCISEITIRYNSQQHIHCIWHYSHCLTSQPQH